MPGRRRLADIDIAVDEQPVRAASFIASGGPYVLTLSTVLPDHGLELHSTYTGHRDAEHTAVTCLFLSPAGAPHPVVTDHLPSAEIPVHVARRRCLYDHLTRLQDRLAAHLDTPIRVALADRGLRAVET